MGRPRKQVQVQTQGSTAGQATASKLAAKFDQQKATSDATPSMVSIASTDEPISGTRRNVAGSIPRTNRYINIEEGMVPFRYSSAIYGPNRSSIDVRDAVVLCQKCYYNFAIFRNIIDLMTEFSISDITLQGGNQQSKDFFNAWLKRINIWDLQDKFYREYYRSGNVFVYRFDGDATPADVRRMNQAFAATDEVPVEALRIPVRYILLNPADIQMMSTLNFAYGMYFKILTDYEIANLRQPKTDEDIAVLNDLPKDVQKQIKTGARVVSIPLDSKKVSMVFYKKQDYEPFAVPMGFPVLEDINYKAELRKIDMAIARTMQQIVLVVTTGAKPDEGGVNPRHIEALRKLFTNQSVGRVLIADYTTKAEFVIPAIADLLDPKKYETVNEDINVGLNNVFAGGDKFANQQQKVELFVSRLEQGRKAFLNNFLLPEMRRIAKSMKFKAQPLPYLEDIELKDSSTMNKIYGRLMELGILTPEQGFKALKTGVLPDADTAHEEQKDYMKKRDDGLYTPLVGGAKEGEEGRPEGATSKPAPKKIGPIGSKASDESDKPKINYSLKQVTANLLVAEELETKVVATLKDMHKIKRMSKLQKEVAAGLVEQIMANEESSKWLETAESYCKNMTDTNPERVLEVNKIAVAHQLDNYLASVLLASKVENG